MQMKIERLPDFDFQLFAETWNCCESIGQVCAITGFDWRTAKSRSVVARRRGFELKKFKKLIARGIEPRFWSKVEVTDNCWNWTGAVNDKGYGQIGSGGCDGPIIYAHRVSWEIHNGKIPDGLNVLHKCDNPPCVNPNHLFLGTQMDNVKDMESKGRGSWQNKPILCPFKILIDTAESHYFAFQGLRADADRHYRPIIVETEFRCLQRHPNSLGDYAPDCGVGRCHVERKSLEDCQGTILGFDGRRERFESELANLAEIEAGVVIVECSLSTLLATAQGRGKKTPQQNAKTLFRSILAYQQDFKTPWIFCDGRRLAEQAAFRWMERWYLKTEEARKAEEKSAAKRRQSLFPPVGVKVQQSQSPAFDSELATL